MNGNYDFSYLIKKIEQAEFVHEPFKHIYIENFFSDEHFEQVINAPEISSQLAANDSELIEQLMRKGFKPISFPGCVTNIDKYISWHERGMDARHHSACEGFGMALRLYEFPSVILKELNSFLASADFNRAVAEKLQVNFEGCIIDGGIQKYLDGYEISPHADIRKKAATFMVNINPSSDSEETNHHTHYLRFKKEYLYIQEFWSGNNGVDRSWVPWEWADTVKVQSRNNSIVLFSPSNDTLHGVKASYNHLNSQRTQLYGNLWYAANPEYHSVEWEQLDLTKKSSEGVLRTIDRKLPQAVSNSIRRIGRKFSGFGNNGKRNI
jgi:hypothetical protein